MLTILYYLLLCPIIDSLLSIVDDSGILRMFVPEHGPVSLSPVRGHRTTHPLLCLLCPLTSAALVSVFSVAGTVVTRYSLRHEHFITMNIPAPRLCKLSRTSLEQKFGFHLTGQKNKPGKVLSYVEMNKCVVLTGRKKEFSV